MTTANRNRTIRSLYHRGKTLIEVAEEFGISRQRVHQIVNKQKGKSAHKGISKKLKESVFKRDNYTCKNCGTKENLTLNHIIPKIAGGQNRKSNLEVLCQKCNARAYMRLVRIAFKFYFKHRHKVEQFDSEKKKLKEEIKKLKQWLKRTRAKG